MTDSNSAQHNRYINGEKINKNLIDENQKHNCTITTTNDDFFLITTNFADEKTIKILAIMIVRK